MKCQMLKPGRYMRCIRCGHVSLEDTGPSDGCKEIILNEVVFVNGDRMTSPSVCCGQLEFWGVQPELTELAK